MRKSKIAHDSLEEEARERTEEVQFRLTRSYFDPILSCSKFAYIASHDLQEPLRTISVYLQLLEEETKAKLDSNDLENLRFAV